MPPTVSAPRTARQLARQELTRAIVERAREQMGEVGPAQLSLRAVARDLGMASSAVYRYFASRDELITALLIIGYDELGEAAEQADAGVRRRSDFTGRWRAMAWAVRDWALAHPHDYALLYGSPVPGYAAPRDTVTPATRVPAVLAALLRDIVDAGRAPRPRGRVPRASRDALAQFHDFAGPGIPDDLAYRGLVAWSALIGTVTLELFGHYVNAIDDLDSYFDEVVRRLDVLAG